MTACLTYDSLTDMSQPDIVTASEAADILGIDKVTVHRYARSGRLPIERQAPGIRGVRWFLRADVEALRDQLAQERAA